MATKTETLTPFVIIPHDIQLWEELDSAAKELIQGRFNQFSLMALEETVKTLKERIDKAIEAHQLAHGVFTMTVDVEDEVKG